MGMPVENANVEQPTPQAAGFRERALASLGAMLGALALLAALWLSTRVGPATRFVIHYFLPVEAFEVLLALPIGVSLGAEAYRLLLPPGRGYSSVRLVAGCLLGSLIGAVAGLFTAAILGDASLVTVPICSLAGGWCGGMALYMPKVSARRRGVPWVRLLLSALMLGWFLVPHFRAFPAHGTLAERDQWTRERVGYYSKLVEIVSRMPMVAHDVGHVIGIAPTSGEAQSATVDMSSQEMHVTLDVVGEAGRGIFRADCSIDGRDEVTDWQSSRWTFRGTSTRVKDMGNILGSAGANP
jgi:hypothetical protein